MKFPPAVSIRFFTIRDLERKKGMWSRRLLKFGSSVTLLITVFLLVVTACAPGVAPAASSNQSAGAGQSASSEKPITLNVWVYPYWSGITGTEDPAKSTPTDIWNYMAKKFQETHPNVSFNFEVMDWGTG